MLYQAYIKNKVCVAKIIPDNGMDFNQVAYYTHRLTYVCNLQECLGLSQGLQQNKTYSFFLNRPIWIQSEGNRNKINRHCKYRFILPPGKTSLKLMILLRLLLNHENIGLAYLIPGHLCNYINRQVIHQNKRKIMANLMLEELGRSKIQFLNQGLNVQK